MPENVKTIDCNFRDKEHEEQVNCRYQLGNILFEKMKEAGTTGMVIASIDESHTQLMTYSVSSADVANILRSLLRALFHDNKVVALLTLMELNRLIKEEMSHED